MKVQYRKDGKCRRAVIGLQKKMEDLTVVNLDDLVEFINGSDKPTKPKRNKKSKRKRKKNKKKNRTKITKSEMTSSQASICRGDEMPRLRLTGKNNGEISHAKMEIVSTRAAEIKSILVHKSAILQKLKNGEHVLVDMDVIFDEALFDDCEDEDVNEEVDRFRTKLFAANCCPMV